MNKEKMILKRIYSILRTIKGGDLNGFNEIEVFL